MKKLNQSAQKIHASRGLCQMHAHKFWWVWLLFLELLLLSKMAKFPFRIMVVKKFNQSESAQRIYASRG